jgi:hypothetical protein
VALSQQKFYATAMNDEAYNFWERWDLERKRLKKSVKDIAQAIDISYDLLRTQRSRTIFPSLPVACWHHFTATLRFSCEHKLQLANTD